MENIYVYIWYINIYYIEREYDKLLSCWTHATREISSASAPILMILGSRNIVNDNFGKGISIKINVLVDLTSCSNSFKIDYNYGCGKFDEVNFQNVGKFLSLRILI